MLIWKVFPSLFRPCKRLLTLIQPSTEDNTYGWLFSFVVVSFTTIPHSDNILLHLIIDFVKQEEITETKNP